MDLWDVIKVKYADSFIKALTVLLHTCERLLNHPDYSKQSVQEYSSHVNAPQTALIPLAVEDLHRATCFLTSVA